MKGRTTIELTDVGTGTKEVVDSENMVTNALAKYFCNLGMVNATPFNSNEQMDENAIFKLLGGILLFDKTLEENVDNIQTPAGIHMTANAAYDYTSNSDVEEFGSFNSSESGWQADGSLKFVYDFTTSQANGDIASVCLTSLEHGYVGEGNKSGNYFTSSHDEYLYSGLSRSLYVDGKTINSMNYPRVINVDLEESTMIVIDYYNLYYNRSYSDEFYGNTGKLKLKKYRIPLTKYDIRDNLNTHILLEEKEIELPEEFLSFVNANSPTTTRTRALSLTDGIYIIYEAGVSINEPSAEIKIIKINLDYTLELYSVVNQTGERLYNISYGYGFVLSDKLVLRAYSDITKCYYINIKNSADFGLIDNKAGIECSNVGRHNMRSFSANRAYFTGFVIDLVNDEILPTNCTSPNKKGSFSGAVRGNPLISLYDVSGSSSGTYFDLLRSQNYLATINNLPNKVTKTSDKTMKVTYTLTFEEAK